MSDELAGKVALVTGASRGIGRAIAVALGKAGANIAVNFLSHEEAAQGVGSEIESAGRRALLVQADVSVASEVFRNAIAPALVETEMITGTPRIRPDIIPIGRFGRVEEVAEVAVMLARNGYITGQTLNVNGGWYMSS